MQRSLDHLQLAELSRTNFSAACRLHHIPPAQASSSAVPPPPFPNPTRRPCTQAEKFRSKAQKSDTWRVPAQYCRYLFYLGTIRAIQLEYSEAKEVLQQVGVWVPRMNQLLS